MRTKKNKSTAKNNYYWYSLIYTSILLFNYSKNTSLFTLYTIIQKILRNCATKESLVDFSWEVYEILFPVNTSEIYCDTSATAIKTGFPYLICMSVLRVVHGIMSHERNYYGICINHELDNTYCTMQKYFYCLNSNWWYVFDFLYFFILNVNFNKI